MVNQRTLFNTASPLTEVVLSTIVLLRFTKKVVAPEKVVNEKKILIAQNGPSAANDDNADKNADAVNCYPDDFSGVMDDNEINKSLLRLYGF